MSVEMETVAVAANGQVILTAPRQGALAVCRVDEQTVRVFAMSEDHVKALLAGTEQSELPADVLEFCRAQELTDYVLCGLKEARNTFTDAARWTLSIKQDEYGDRYVNIDAAVRDDPNVEAEKYSACMERRAAVIPPHAGSKIQLTTSWA